MSQRAAPGQLNAQQQRFVAEYAKCLNATHAAIAAGYSKKTARMQGSRLMTNADIQAAIAAKTAQKLDKIEEKAITADRILVEFSRICQADLRRVTDDAGRILSIKDWPDDMAAAIASVEVTTDKFGAQTTKIKLWDKVNALSNMAKHYGLLKDLVEHSGDVTYRWIGDDGVEVPEPSVKA